MFPTEHWDYCFNSPLDTMNQPFKYHETGTYNHQHRTERDVT